MVARRSVLAIAAALGATLTWRVSSGQQTAARVPRIGAILTGDSSSISYAAFRQGLMELGYVEGQNFIMEPRFAAGQFDRLPAFAAELVALRVDVIACVGAVSLRAAQAATADIPIVFAVVVDPVALGLVTNLERPGGNATGVTNFDSRQPRSQMELLKQTVPGLQRVAILGDAGVPDALANANKAAAEAVGLRAQVVLLKAPGTDLDAAFAAIREERADALLALEVPLVGVHAKKIFELAAAARLPTMFGADWASLGPMLAYGTSFLAATRRMSALVDRILKGAKPGDLPVEAITRHGLVVNQKVARAIGVTIPPAVLARADKVID